MTKDNLLHEIASKYAQDNFPIDENGKGEAIKHGVAFHSFCDGWNAALSLNSWKSVKDELPKEIKYESITLQGKKEFTYSEHVIVLASTGKVFMTNLRNGKWNCSRYDTDGFDIEITHWMPIPELPKEETK